MENTTINNDVLSVSVEVKNGIPVVSSRQVAQTFEKQHKDVLESIRGIMRSAENSADLDSWFIESTEADAYGREQKVYLMTRDGFSLLVMGFTGKKALQWKIAYINAFNEMEKALKEGTQVAMPMYHSDVDALHYAGEFSRILSTQFGIDAGIARSYSLVRSERVYGVNFEEVKKLLPPAPTNTQLINPTQIGKEFDGMNAYNVNLWLEHCKLQVNINGQWIPTEEGEQFAKFSPYTNHKSKHSDRQLK